MTPDASLLVSQRFAHSHQDAAELVAATAVTAVAPEVVVVGVLDELRVASAEEQCSQFFVDGTLPRPPLASRRP